MLLSTAAVVEVLLHRKFLSAENEVSICLYNSAYYI